MNQAILGIDVGGTTAKAVVAKPNGELLASGLLPTGGGEEATAAVRRLARDLQRQAVRRGFVVAAAGIVTPGLIDQAGRVVTFASNLRWSDLPLADLVEADLGVPVTLANDATSAGLAELRFGHARGCPNFVHISIGTGIGASLVVDGRVLSGARGGAGELGHITVFSGGDECTCGRRGCLDAYAAAAGMMRRYRSAGGLGATSVPELVAARLTDPVAGATWRDAITALARGIAAVTMLTDPDLVVLGGGVAGAGAVLTEPLQDLLARELVWKTAPQVLTSALGDQGGRAGALAVAVTSLPPQTRPRWTLERLVSLSLPNTAHT